MVKHLVGWPPGGADQHGHQVSSASRGAYRPQRRQRDEGGRNLGARLAHHRALIQVSRQVGEIDQILPPSLLQHPAGVREQRNGAVRRERQLTLADLDPPPLARDLVDLLGQLVSDLRGDTLRHTGISLQTEGRERAIPALRGRAGTARGGSVHGDSARALDVLMRARPPLIGTVASGGSSRSAMESTGSSAKPPGSGSSPVPSADRMDAWTASLSGAHAVGIGTCPSSRQSRPREWVPPGRTLAGSREPRNRPSSSRDASYLPFASPRGTARQRRSAHARSGTRLGSAP